MSKLKNKVGLIIKQARKAKGLTQKELGEKLGINHTTVNGYENGNQNLTLDTLEKIADALDIEPKNLFE